MMEMVLVEVVSRGNQPLIQRCFLVLGIVYPAKSNRVLEVMMRLNESENRFPLVKQSDQILGGGTGIPPITEEDDKVPPPQ